MKKLNLQTILNLQNLSTILKDYHPYDIANEFINLEAEDQQLFVNNVDDEMCAMVFSYIDDETIEEIIYTIGSEKAAKILSQMESDDATDVLGELDEEDSDDIIKHMDDEVAKELTSLSKYQPKAAGSIMNTNFIKIENNIDVKQAMKTLVKNAPEVESINTLFVCDEVDTLLGTVDLKKLITAKSPCLIDAIMDKNYKYIDATDHISLALKIIDDYDVYDLPVIEDEKLVGAITIDDAIEALVDESNEDYAKLAGLASSEGDHESTFSSIKKRIPWLAILLILDIFVAMVISSYDYLFTDPYNLTVLVIFQPIILSLSGNCGTQSLAVTVRSISNYELDTNKKIIKNIVKESLSGILIGLAMGILSFAFTYGLLYIRHDVGNSLLSVAFIVSISVFISISVANLVGSLIPTIFHKCKIDPAVASGPFITTINDMISIIIYFTLATVLIANLL